MDFAIFVKITLKLLHLFFQCFEIKPIYWPRIKNNDRCFMWTKLCLKWRKYYVGYIFVW